MRAKCRDSEYSYLLKKKHTFLELFHVFFHGQFVSPISQKYFKLGAWKMIGFFEMMSALNGDFVYYFFLFVFGKLNKKWH